MEQTQEDYTLVARKPNFGLPTACPICLPVYIYLKFARFPFRLDFNSTYPDSASNNGLRRQRHGQGEGYNLYLLNDPNVTVSNFQDEGVRRYNLWKGGGVIQRLKEDGIIDLDSEFQSVPEWISMKAMVSSWLADAIMYELWLGTDGNCACKIYYSDLPWIIGKALFVKQVYVVKQRLGITKENAEKREEEIYSRAKIAFGALSNRLGEQNFLFDRPSSLDASLLAHVLFTLNVLPETSVLRSTLLEYGNMSRYAEKLKTEFLEASSSSSSYPQTQSDFSSSFQRKGSSNSNSKPKRKPKREKTQEEKDFSRRAKYFLVTQLVAVVLFVSLMGGYDFSEAEDGDEGLSYD